MKIIGAGLSGLLAGCMFPGSIIYERQSKLPNNHGAILRFRSDKISQALGIPFKKVRVTKGIWSGETEVQPTPRIQNMYSRKVLGRYSNRSISNIDPVDRWIAPDDFIAQLAERCTIKYDAGWVQGGWTNFNGSIISTIPMQRMMTMIGLPVPGGHLLFEYQPIWTHVYEFNDVDLYQTIYFPDKDTYVYRASFTGNKLIVESTADPLNVGAPIYAILSAFGVDLLPASGVIKEQQYGKIIDIDNDLRRSIMATLTHDHNIYSLGRFATWRNILLDDVFEDIIKIRDLIKLDSYSRRLQL